MVSVSLPKLKRSLKRKTKHKKPGPIPNPLGVASAGEVRGEKMAYKIPIENIETAIYYGQSHNRHDLYQFDDETGTLSLTALKVTPEQSSHTRVAEYNLKTRVFTALVWDDVVRSLKQTVSLFLLNILAVYEVGEIVGPPGFMAKWEPRMDLRKRLLNHQSWKQNDYYTED